MEGRTRNGRLVEIAVSGRIRVFHTDDPRRFMVQRFHSRRRKLLVPTVNTPGTLTFASRPQGRAATGMKRPENKVATRVLGRVDEWCDDCCGSGLKLCAETSPIYGTVVLTGAGFLLTPPFDVPDVVISALRSAAPKRPALTAFDRAIDWLAGVPGRAVRERNPPLA